jgi:hypothetical protein
MKKSISAAILILVLAVVGYLAWTRFNTPVSAEIRNPQIVAGALQGTLVNTGGQTLSKVDLTAKFAGANGQTLAIKSSSYTGLQPGQSVAIQIPAPQGTAGFSTSLDYRAGGL